MLEVFPLATTQVDWKTFVDVSERLLGYSPTRGLDTVGLDLKDAAAYLACLDFDNEPLKQLRTGMLRGQTFNHVFFSFLVVCDDNLRDDIWTLGLDVTSKDIRRGEYILIVSGTIEKWHDVTIKFLSTQDNKWLRVFLNLCVAFFKQTGYRYVWDRYTQVQQQDQTFLLK